MHIYKFNPKTGLTEIDGKFSGKAINKKPGFMWMDVADPSADDLRDLAKHAGLLPETLEVIMDQHQPPIIETQEKLAAFVFHIPSVSGTQQVYAVKPLIFLIGAGFIVTIRYHDYSWIAALKNSLAKNPKEIGDNPYMLFYRAVRRIIKDIQAIINGWETAMSDFSADNIYEAEDISLVRLFKIKAAAEELYIHLLDSSEIFDFISDKHETRNPDLSSLKSSSHLWESLIEQTSMLIRKIENSLEAFRVITVRRQRRAMHMLSRIAFFGFPILIAFSIASLILPQLETADMTKTVLFVLITLLAGTAAGAGLSALFKE
jgi:Mg2+ and Co2+ transporter CorA